jgi:hypothetical protein
MKIYNLIIGLLLVVFCNGQTDSLTVLDTAQENVSRTINDSLLSIQNNTKVVIQSWWNPFEYFLDSNQFEMFTGGPGNISRSLFFELDKDKLLSSPFFFNEQPTLPSYVTDTPVVEATYLTGNEQEQNFSIFHTQNISANSNYAVSYLKRSFDGYFENQSTNHSYFQSNFSTSSQSNKYNGVLGFKQHKLFNQQNGGIVDDSSFTTVDAFSANRKLLDVNLMHAYSIEKAHNLYINHSFCFVDNTDSLLNTKQKYFRLNSSLSRRSRVYFDSLNADDFLYNYSDTVASHDSLIKGELSTSLFFLFENSSIGKNKKFSFGIKSSLINHKNLLVDTVLDNFNIFINYGLSVSNLQLDSRIKYFFSGYRNSNLDFTNYLTFNINDSKIDLNVNASSLTPSFEYRRFFSNHHQWQNDIADQTVVDINASFSFKSLVLQHCFFEINNPIYFNHLANPHQFNGKSQVLQTALKHELLFNKFHLKSQVVYQYQGGAQVYQLPDFVSSIDLSYIVKPKQNHFKLFFGLKTKLFSEFNLMDYDPVLNSFLVNNSLIQKKYFISDFEFKFMLNNVTFYTLLTHLNAGLLGNNYFTAIHYPYPDRYLKFGLKWLFLN